MTQAAECGLAAESPERASIQRLADAQQKGMPSKLPRRKSATSKTRVISPEARRAIEEKNRSMIDEFIATGKVEKCPVRWAGGAWKTKMLGGPEA